MKTRKKKFTKLQCSPVKSSKMKKYSCYSSDNLLIMRDLWNKNNIDNKILYSEPFEIWKEFKKKLNTKCYNELCWLNENVFNDINKQQIIKEMFRPFAPVTWKEQPYQWLTSVEILEVMEQYKHKFSNFEFIGPSPIDFDSKELSGTCVWKQLCNLQLSNFLNQNPPKTKIGIIFNTHPHYKSGEHWISLFIDLDKNFIFYFDSNGDKEPKEIRVLVKRIQKQGKLLNIKLPFYSNKGKEHQLKDGQCGVYCLYFIVQLLRENKDYLYFKKHRIKDEDMRDYRLKFFNQL